MNKLISAILLFVFVGFSANASWLNDTVNHLKGFGGMQEKGQSSNLSKSKIAAGLKEALSIAVSNTVSKLGRVNGFYKDRKVHIPLPSKLESLRGVLDRIGLSGKLDKLEIKLNRAAELATPKAKELFLDAIKHMTIRDVYRIYKGPDDAATQYFRENMGEKLKSEMRPIVDKTLSEVDAVKTYNSIVNSINTLPFGKKVNLNLTDYVLNKAEDGIFYYMAKEEEAIRKDPAKRVTELLREVFGR